MVSFEIFHWHNPSGLTMALGPTKTLTEMSAMNISWGVKAAGALGWSYHLHVPTVLKSGSLNLLEPSGPVQACNGIALLFICKNTECEHRSCHGMFRQMLGFLRDEVAVHGTEIKETPCGWAHSTPMSIWPVCALLMHGETKEIFSSHFAEICN